MPSTLCPSTPPSRYNTACTLYAIWAAWTQMQAAHQRRDGQQARGMYTPTNCAHSQRAATGRGLDVSAGMVSDTRAERLQRRRARQTSRLQQCWPPGRYEWGTVLRMGNEGAGSTICGNINIRSAPRIRTATSVAIAMLVLEPAGAEGVCERVHEHAESGRDQWRIVLGLGSDSAHCQHAAHSIREAYRGGGAAGAYAARGWDAARVEGQDADGIRRPTKELPCSSLMARAHRAIKLISYVSAQSARPLDHSATVLSQAMSGDALAPIARRQRQQPPPDSSPTLFECPVHSRLLHAVKDNSHPLTLHPHFYVYPGLLPGHAHDLTLDLVSPNRHFTISPDAAIADIPQIVILRYGQEAPPVPFMRAARPFGGSCCCASSGSGAGSCRDSYREYADEFASWAWPAGLLTACWQRLIWRSAAAKAATWTFERRALLRWFYMKALRVRARAQRVATTVKTFAEKAVNAGADGNEWKEREQEGKGVNAGTEGEGANGGKDAAGPAKKAKTGGTA
ncbi:hypothetical protein C8R44DRAFT_861909 [Mycena epipterygia]|nr:hypothetical protein C8R44DRAFT_861909 [Mycena epipterygia]